MSVSYGCAKKLDIDLQGTFAGRGNEVEVGDSVVGGLECGSTSRLSNLLAMDLRLDVRNDRDGLHCKFQHAEYFTCDPLITRPIFIRFSGSFHQSSSHVRSFLLIAHTL